MLGNWVDLSLCYESRLLSFLCVVLEDSQKLTQLPGITASQEKLLKPAASLWGKLQTMILTLPVLEQDSASWSCQGQIQLAVLFCQ